MTAYMLDTFNPTLVQTLKAIPVLVHAGPFANIAIGQNSVIADKIVFAFDTISLPKVALEPISVLKNFQI